MNFVKRARDVTQRAWRVVIAFCVARLILGFAMLMLFERDVVAWGWQLTAVAAGTVAVYVCIAMVIRGGAGARTRP